MIKGQIISGDFSRVIVRQKSNTSIELGELLLAKTKETKILLQVYDLIYGSQLSQQNLELISGMKLEEDTEVEFLDPKLRNYTLALLKTLITIEGTKVKMCKSLPPIFTPVYEIKEGDLEFLSKPDNPLYVGDLRSGSKVLNTKIYLDGAKAFTHHILITATTGRGKSNLTACMLWDTLDKDYCGILVLDPHDEYYGRNKLGLKDHPKHEKVVYYTPRNTPGCRTLKINLSCIKPQHFAGIVNFTDAQKQALNLYYKKFNEKWIEALIMEKPLLEDEEDKKYFQKATLTVVKRKLLSLLDLDYKNKEIICNGIFDTIAGESTIKDICNELEVGKIVIIDTSNFSGVVEILIGSLIATNIFDRYRNYKMSGILKEKPVISIVLEEAPRVLGKDILEKGPNIFSTIAREGKKFKIGLTAITQLPSLIPKQILSNMNTKIILGLEMASERQAIIDSASQDLSSDSRNIASLDVGEAIITSNFTKFAIPIKIPLFKNIVKNTIVKRTKKEFKKDFSGIDLG